MQLDTQLGALEGILNEYLFNSQKIVNYSKVQVLAKTLTNFSKRREFLSIAFYYLTHYEHPSEKILLLVTLIKDKFKYDFENIENFQIPNYYDRLCELAAKIRYSKISIFKQISMSLAYIYLNLSSSQQIPLPQYLSPLVPKQNPAKDEQSLVYNYYFRVLQQIASQIDNTKLVIDDYSREYARSQIVGYQQSILSILNQQAIQLWNNKLINKDNVFRCFASWIQLRYRCEILNSLPQHQLMPFLFEYLSDIDGIDVAVDCLKTIIEQIRNPIENAPLIEYLGFNIVQLITTAEKYIRKKEIQDAEIYIDLVLFFCEKALHIFTQNTAEVMEFLNKLVNFTKNKTFKIYKNFIDFWESFVQQIISKSDGFPDPKFKILIQDLYMAICSQCRFPSQIISRFQTRQQKQVVNQNSTASQIEEQRELTCELFQLIAKYLGQQVYVGFVCEKISQLNCNDSSFWSHLEVLLFSMVTPLKKINFINETLYLLVNTSNQLYHSTQSTTPIAVRRIFLRLFRSLLNNRQKDKEIVQRIFFYSSACLKVDLISHQADKTFCRGCELNGKILAKDIPAFIQIMLVYINREHIVLGVFYIICSTQQTINQYLLSTLLIITANINSLPKCPKRRDIMNSLAAVTKLLKETKIIQKNLNIIKQFIRISFPMIKEFLQERQSTKQDENFEIERTVKMLKNLMRCLGLQFWQFTPALCECVINSFVIQPICSYLYLIEILITIFSKDKKYDQFILNLYCKFCEYALNHLSNSTNIQKYNFLLDDFLGMNKRLFIYNAEVILKSNNISILIQKCLDYVGCKIPRIAKAAYTFFEVIFMAYWRPEFIDKYNEEADKDSFNISKQQDPTLYFQLKLQLSDKLHYIVAKMLSHLSQNPVQMIQICIFEALIAELKAFPQWNSEIWRQLIMPLPHDIFRQKQKQDFMGYLQRMKQQDFSLVEGAKESLQKLLNLMGKRLAVATKRKDAYLN